MLSSVRTHWRVILFGSLCALFAGAAFFLITFLVRADLLKSIDFNITVLIQDKVPHRADEYLNWFGVIAKFQFIVPGLVIFLLLMRRWWLAISSLALLFVAHLLELVGKEILFQPPPPFMFYRHPTEFIFPDLHTFDHSSYPSGHSMRIVFTVLTVMVVLAQSRKTPLFIKIGTALVLFGVAFLTMFSRISLGEHWTSDVVGGLFLGVMIAALNIIVAALTRGKASTLPREENNS